MIYASGLANRCVGTSFGVKMIHIGNPIQFDEDEFYFKLAKLKDSSYKEIGDIKEMIKEICNCHKIPNNIRMCHSNRPSICDLFFK